ncbi:hypothetical protein K488DRAFT_92922 [Vararia minispora EC-137]|uniref:Uncharacterized protein n=1 Tax=Vararia minispora EC-137 TaxID=1314806 RepID=A0ACB8Q3P9_9AGAM|nr:hypothetical protein K488DRAFT_92922 [Vararia minispora EC-137]
MLHSPLLSPHAGVPSTASHSSPFTLFAPPSAISHDQTAPPLTIKRPPDRSFTRLPSRLPSAAAPLPRSLTPLLRPATSSPTHPYERTTLNLSLPTVLLHTLGRAPLPTCPRPASAPAHRTTMSLSLPTHVSAGPVDFLSSQFPRTRPALTFFVQHLRSFDASLLCSLSSPWLSMPPKP